MVELIRSGCPNVVCTQPFACLPNHVVGKATIKELRRRYPESNIVAVDYDPGASEVNQLNRIKLMIAVAKANLAEKEAEARAARDAARDGAPEDPEPVAETVEALAPPGGFFVGAIRRRCADTGAEISLPGVAASGRPVQSHPPVRRSCPCPLDAP